MCTKYFSSGNLGFMEPPNLESVWNEDPAEIVTEANSPDPKETNPKFTLPSVTSLTLWDLPKFTHNSIHCIHDATAKVWPFFQVNMSFVKSA